MRSPLVHSALLLVLLLLPARHGLSAQAGGRTCEAPLAVVLSGGGAKGFAHIGVLRAMDSLGIHPDFIVGTSMGALVGTLYAAGYSGRQLDSLVHAPAFAELFHGHGVAGSPAWGGLLPLVTWDEGEHGFAVQGGALGQADPNAALNAALLRANLQARGDFSRLPTPLAIVATDLRTRGVVVLRHGDVAQAVRASIAIPLIFAPEQMGDTLLADGGLTANVPVSVARSLGAKRVIISDVTEHGSDTLNPGAPLVVADRLINWLFRQPEDSLGPGDVLLRLPVEDFAALDFAPAVVDTLIRLGGAVAGSQLGRAGCAGREGNGSRAAPRMPQRIVAVSADDSATVRLVGSLLRLTPGAELDVGQLEQRLLALSDRHLFRELWLHPTGSGDSVAFAPVLRRLPRREAAIGLAYDNELGGRAWAGVLDRLIPVVRGEGSAVIRSGRYSNALDLTLRRATILGLPDLSPVASLGFSADELRRFNAEGVELASDSYRQLVASGGIERNFGPRTRLSLAGIAMLWHETTPVARATRNDRAIGGRLLLERYNADRARVVRLDVQVTNVFTRARFEGALQQRFGLLRMTEVLDAGVGHALPAGLTFPLGVNDGFPGLHLGERRGDRHATLGLALSYPLIGPLRLRASGAVGKAVFADSSSATPPSSQRDFVTGSFFNTHDWRAGGRIGVEADTPLGAVRAEYGWSTGGRHTLFLRVGRWF